LGVSIFGEWLRAELDGRDHMTQSELQRRLEKRGGIKTQGAVSRWINGARIEPPNARALADELGYERFFVLYLAGYGDEPVPDLDPYTMSQADLDDAVTEAVAAARAYEERMSGGDSEGFNYVAVPITGRIGAGDTIDNDHAVVQRPRWLKRLPGNLQAAEIVGDCLADRIQPGDLAIIDPDASWGPGTIIAVRSNGGVQVKEFVRHEPGGAGPGRLVLTSNHGEFTVPDDDVRIVGVMVTFQGRASGF
jgi:phage repressor protein C with HTH and peptisase S24 domain